MLCAPELAYQIALGNKTQTRRPRKPGDKLIAIDGIKRVVSASGKLKHAVGSIRTVQYAYGKPCRWWHPEERHLLTFDGYLLHINHWENNALGIDYEDVLSREGFERLLIEITDIHAEDVRDISAEDAIAEACDGNSRYGFLKKWSSFYDATVLSQHDPLDTSTLFKVLKSRPAKKYDGFAYTFRIHSETRS
jgi:hypothetical protein